MYKVRFGRYWILLSRLYPQAFQVFRLKEITLTFISSTESLYDKIAWEKNISKYNDVDSPKLVLQKHQKAASHKYKFLDCSAKFSFQM